MTVKQEGTRHGKEKERKKEKEKERERERKEEADGRCGKFSRDLAWPRTTYAYKYIHMCLHRNFELLYFVIKSCRSRRLGDHNEI
jgi:hypothetical protein